MLGLDKQKLYEGRNLIRYFCIPCAPTKTNGGRTRNLPVHDMEKWEMFKFYNKRDVETEMAIQEKLHKFPVPDFIWDEYHLDQEINDRGIGIDLEFVDKAIEIDKEVKNSLLGKMQKLTGLANPNSVQQMKEWLTEKGMEIDSLGKKDVAELIKTAPEGLIDVLKLRQQVARSSIKKYQAMANAVCHDVRAHGMFQFYGANRTGRFSGRLIQLQNLPQNHISDLAEARVLVKSGNMEALNMLYDDIPDTLSQLIRTAFVPQKGWKFIVSDYSSIEARIIAWLAGEEWRLDVFEEGGDIYCASASQMFKVPVVKHATDPASGKELNAFDLVRVHLFPDDDDKASFNKMAEFASQDELVKSVILRKKQEEAKAEFEDWTEGLQRDKSGRLSNNLHNVKLIMENDENLKPICFNQLADGMEIKGEVPWKHPAKFWRDADDAQLICYIDDNYGAFSQRNYQIGVAKVTDDRAYHPIKNFFAGLPEWDGVVRAETLLIDYLGAEDNEYTRMVTRKTLCAAVARIEHPGIKFDYILVLNGDQGIGKSTLIARLGKEWYSDSLALTDMNDKTAAEKLQGYWIMEIGELAGMKKADIDKVKAFISRQDDKYRASFGRRVTPHPRQCIFIGTTNSQNGYLRDITGNRRFWTVKTPGTGRLKPWQLTDEDAKQIWAEAIVLQKNGEKLYLDRNLEKYAQDEQAEAMEQDDREGLVRSYLEMLLPENWPKMDGYARRDYFIDPGDPTRIQGTIKRNVVCNLEIWCECFGKRKEDIKPSDSYAIAAIMLRIKGWRKTKERSHLSIYGLQRLYKRV